MFSSPNSISEKTKASIKSIGYPDYDKPSICCNDRLWDEQKRKSREDRKKKTIQQHVLLH